MLFWIGIAIMIASGVFAVVVGSKVERMSLGNRLNGWSVVSFVIGFVVIVIGITRWPVH